MDTVICAVAGCVLFLAVCAAPAHAGKDDWGYSGDTGPENWYRVDPSYAVCKEGKHQTPIDIRPNYDVDLPPLSAAYGVKGTSIVNNGHTVQVNFPAGNTLTVDGRVFSLLQAHFHAPSENSLNGVAYPFEGHFVHQDADGNLAVLAVFYQEGADSPGFASLWKHMPAAKGQELALGEGFDALSIVPQDKDYIYFSGSLTTPPCSEGVRWYVLKAIGSIGKGQVKQFADVMHHANNRPLQPVNARVIVD